MSKTNANVIVHVKQDVDGTSLRTLQMSLVNLSGVRRVAPSKPLDRLMLIDYDPRVVSSQAILADLRRRGVDAQLVGM